MSDQNRWLDVRDSMSASGGESTLTPGGRFAELMHRAPAKLLELTAIYKFAAKMIGPDKKVIEPWCNEGLGAWIIGKECGHCVGMDPDKGLIELAAGNYPKDKVSFAAGDFMSMDVGVFDALVCLDIGGHVPSHEMDGFMDRAISSLEDNGVIILSGGSAPSGMEVGPDGWLAELGGRYFRHVFPFNAGDEIVRAGFDSASRTHIVVACGPLSDGK